MKGDLLRYKAEVMDPGKEQRGTAFASQQAYDDADACARVMLPVVHPTRLRNIVNLTILMHDILANKKEGIELATKMLRTVLENYELTTDANMVSTGMCIYNLRQNLDRWGTPFQKN